MRTEAQSRFHTDSLSTTIRRFFFSEEIPYGLALVRISLPLVLLFVRAFRWTFTREIYSADGAPAQLGAGYGYPQFVPELPGAIAVGLNTFLLIALFTSAIGWRTRTSLWIATILYTYFGLLDSLSTMTKYTVIASHAMLLLSVSRCGSVWSVDAWLGGKWQSNPRSDGPQVLWQQYEVWPQRLLQILVGTIYLGAAMTKMHTPAFFSGDQLLYWMMTYVTGYHPIGEYLTQFPGLIVISGYLTIIWEVTFLFCCWSGWGRIYAVWMGVAFHIMTTFMLGLVVFPLVMIAIYLSFLNEHDVRWLLANFRWMRQRAGKFRLVQKLPTVRLPRLGTPDVQLAKMYSLPAFAMLSALLVMVGIEVEYRMDVYGERRTEGRHTLKEISAEQVMAMTGPEIPLRESDKFLAFDLGTTLVGGRLWDRTDKFRPGQQVICEASLNPPHSDMWLEVNLHDEKNRVVFRNGQVIPRENYRGHFSYTLPKSLEAGKYFMVLRSRGKEIDRREFTLLPSDSVALRGDAPVAN